MGFEEYAFGLRFRDTIKDLVKNMIDTERPRHRYATVTAVSTANGTATVIFNGDANAPIQVSLIGLTPIVGDVVQVSGIGADRFVSGIVGGKTAPLDRRPFGTSGLNAYKEGVWFSPTTRSTVGIKDNGDLFWNSDNYARTDANERLNATVKVPLFNMEMIELGNTENLNDLTSPGLYHQAANAEASTARNYPVAKAGFIEVYTRVNENNSSYVYQRYTEYNSGAIWVRSKYSSTWYAWRLLNETPVLNADHFECSHSTPDGGSVPTMATGWSRSTNNTGGAYTNQVVSMSGNQFTVNRSGVHAISLRSTFSSRPMTRGFCQIVVTNGTYRDNWRAVMTGEDWGSTTMIEKLVAGDVVRVEAYQQSGSALTARHKLMVVQLDHTYSFRNYF